MAELNDTYSYEEDPVYDRSEDVIIQSIYLIILVLGALLLLILILCKRELREKPLNWIVISGLIGILLRGLVNKPLVIALLGYAKGTLAGCVTIYFLYYLYEVPFMLAAIALDQVLMKMCQEKYARKAAVVSYIVGSWLLSIIIAIVLVAFVEPPMLVEVNEGRTLVCATTSSSRDNPAYIFGFLYIPPMIITFILACFLLPCSNRKKYGPIHGDSTAPNYSVALVWVTLIVYVITTLPMQIFIVIGQYTSVYEKAYVVQLYMSLYYLSQLFQPILPYLWIFLLPDVRSEFSKIFCWCCKPKDDEEKFKLVSPQ